MIPADIALWFSNSRLRLFSVTIATLLVIFSLTRIGLLAYSDFWVDLFHVSGLDILRLLGVGFVNDLLVVTYIAIPLSAYLFLVPRRIYKHNQHQHLLMFTYVLLTFCFTTTAVAEFFFWDEFTARFNFISVDYLIYRREVTGNIFESYPVYQLLLLALLGSVLLTYIIRRTAGFKQSCGWSFRTRAGHFLAITAIAVTAGLLLNGPTLASENNRYMRELGLNGVYQFFHAFNANQLNYRENYQVAEDNKVAHRLQQLISNNATPVGDKYSVLHRVESQQPALLKNVFLVVIESLSAKYVGYYGGGLGLTPNLDRLAESSLHFDNFYATGTRTVRGLEAISLSIPPTPGRSIVKRTNNTGLFSIANVFNQFGYESTFMYGGYGYFDNMNAFFSGNGFKIVDESDFSAAEVTFSNIWGVADEDLYRKAMQAADATRAQRKPFFSLLMTTSNHRPYTYPPGRIDIPSGDGRYGAVKYTDFAIGQFLSEARRHDWFEDTVFVFVADHTAGSAGKVDLDVNKYRIPLLIYSSRDIKPGRVMTLSSQIDLAPTLLSLLHFDYDSRFFGQDILAMPAATERALIANYQKLGLLTPQSLTILSPQKKAIWVQDPFGEYQVEHLVGSDHRLDDVIAWYQGADYVYTQGLNRVQ